MYQALYRKWRPRTFADVLSQPQVTVTLQNQIRRGKTAHAYLFTGSRGTGKTTCARILASAVNCENPTEDGNPCTQCQNCYDAERGILSDIIEIDAASNNSVEDIRDLRDAAVYTPERCCFKIYIIDEVHMLSTNAFNALLKIMEEPPEYIKFILATTEIHKVPATIISRCQRFDFRRIQQEDLVTRLQYIAREENILLEESAAQLMARLSDGGMRDAISLLDRCGAYGETITTKLTAEAAGAADRSYLFEILESILTNNVGRILDIVATLYQGSKDLRRLCDELIVLLRDCMVWESTRDYQLLYCMADEFPQLEELARRQGIEKIMERLAILQSTRERLGRSQSPRVELEMALLGLATVRRQVVVAKPSEVIQPVMPTMATAGSIPKKTSPKINSELNSTPPTLVREQTATQGKSVASGASNSGDWQDIPLWAEVLEELERLNPALLGTMEGAVAKTNGDILYIKAKNPFFMTVFREKDNVRSLSLAVKHILGKEYNLQGGIQREELADRPVENMLEKARNSGISTTAVT